MYSKLSAAAVVLAAASQISAQTSSKCGPAPDKAKCPDVPAFGKTGASCDFTKGPCDLLKGVPGTKITNFDPVKGAEFQISAAKQAPTMASDNYLWFGKLTVVCQAAKGAGIVTSVVLISDDLDEIDWEWVGNDHSKVQTNFFAKGDVSTYDRGQYHDKANSMEDLHTYVLDWKPEELTWSIDGAVVRTLKKGNPSGYPVAPSQIKIGTWIGGAEGAPEGTVKWAGGLAQFTKEAGAPFNGYYKSVTVEDYCGGTGPCTKDVKSYHYVDKSGTADKIEAKSDGASTGSSSSSSSASSASESATSSSASSSETASVTPTESGATTKPTTGSGIGFAGNNGTSNGSNGTIGGTGNPSQSSSGPGQTGVPGAGFRSAANIVSVVAGGLLAAYFAL